jgi:hypothetical protein
MLLLFLHDPILSPCSQSLQSASGPIHLDDSAGYRDGRDGQHPEVEVREWKVIFIGGLSKSTPRVAQSRSHATTYRRPSVAPAFSPPPPQHLTSCFARNAGQCSPPIDLMTLIHLGTSPITSRNRSLNVALSFAQLSGKRGQLCRSQLERPMLRRTVEQLLTLSQSICA